MILWVYTVLLIFTFVNILIPISGTVTVTPLLALLTDPHSAIGLASFYFAIGSTIRAIIFWKNIKWKIVKEFLLISIIGAAIGAFALIKINPNLVLFIILLFLLFFFYKRIRKEEKGKESILIKKLKPAGNYFFGGLSGFLQGTGLAGSDLRNGYLYSKGLNLSEVHGTTAIVGASNFLVATAVRLYTDQLTIHSLTPILYLIPLILVATLIGKFTLNKISKEFTDKLILFIMVLMAILLILKLIRII